MVYEHRAVFSPSQLYPDLNFKLLKEYLYNKINGDIIDYGSIVVISNENYSVSINNIGKIIIFYNKLNQDFANYIASDMSKYLKAYDYNIQYVLS